MLDGEMKRLNATGNYINKKQAQLITPDQENRLWELGLLGEHIAQVLLNTIWGVEWTQTTQAFTPSNPAWWATRWTPISSLSRRRVQDEPGVLLATKRSRKKYISMQIWKIHPDISLGCTSSTIAHVPWMPVHFTSLCWPDWRYT